MISAASQSYPENLIPQAEQCLLADQARLLRAWRQRFHPANPPSPRGLFALEQLLLPRPTQGDANEHIRYVAARLAKLGVPLAMVHAAAAEFRALALDALRPRFGPRAAEAIEAWMQQRSSQAVAEAYVAAQSKAAQALLAVLDAELNSGDIQELLQRVLAQAAQLFPICVGEILLVEPDLGFSRRDLLRRGAVHGALYAESRRDQPGEFFDNVLRRGAPSFISDAGNGRAELAEFRRLGLKSVWAVPLARAGLRERDALGVLVVAFDRVYECLPQERELLLALAERLTMAIERTRMSERLGRQQQRVLELSRRLLDAQDEERRRISRDLHDGTGQSLLALRMYLELGLRQPNQAGTRAWLRRGIELVDSSVGELRRILAELSPLLLDELGLETALRVELRRLRLQQGWRAKFSYATAARHLDRGMEILVYRVVLEGLRNIARHAQASRVDLKIAVQGSELRIRLSDDGVGMAPRPALPLAPTHFGLSGMRERVRLAGGQLELGANDGVGVRISIRIPMAVPVQALGAQAS